MTALQRALDAIDAQAADPLIRAKVRGLMIGYDARWADAGWETISAEEFWNIPIRNPATGKRSRTFTQAGKYDGIISRDGRTYLRENKTTSESIEDPNDTYWRVLTIDSQVSHYMLSNIQAGRMIDGCVYDVIKKPGILPKQIPAAERKLIVQHGVYHDYEVPNHIRLQVSQGQERECVHLYEMRLAADCTRNPNKYFQRRTISRLDNEIVEFASELWDVSQAIINTRQTNAHFRNSAACKTYGVPCPYLPLCSGEDDVDSGRWEHAEQRHAELPILEDGGVSVLTNSRIKCYQTCRRKHLLQYEQGVRRVGGEEREALVFGSLTHVALEAWWLFFKKETENGASSENGPAAIEVARPEANAAT